MKKGKLVESATKADIENAIAQLTTVIIKNVPSKQDHQRLESKVNQLDQKVDSLDQKVNGLDHKVENLASDMSDVRRRMIDLEHDTPSQADFDKLKKRVDRLESAN